ncbi:YncE family protein [Dyella choica]|uniref:YncE family protein n=1 Tax=Dyella choica TaxID=1927959 RepID=UPI0013159149|nr:PD40 domain-containing protein [Dyella choica]
MASPDNCWLFVSINVGKGGGAVAVLRNNSGKFELDHVAPLKSEAYGEALSHDGHLLAVAGGNDTSVLDVQRLEHDDGSPLLGMLHSGSGAGAVYAAISHDGKLAFVSDEDSARISVFDLSKLQNDGSVLIDHIPTSGFPVGLAFSPDGRWLYATSQRGPASMQSTCKPELPNGQMHPPGLLFKIDTAKAAADPRHALVAGLPAGCNPVRVAVAPDGKELWVTARGDNALLRFQVASWPDGAGQAGVTSLSIGPSPVGVAVRPDGKQVWTALSNRFAKDAKGQLVGLSDLENSAQLKRMSIPADGFPRELSFLPDGRTLIATLFDAKQVEFVPTPD